MRKNHSEEYLRKLIEEVQRKAFMEGYNYAIRILQERIPQNEKQSEEKV